MTAQNVTDGRKCAENHRPENIVIDVGIGAFVTTDGHDDLRAEQDHDQCIEDGSGDSAVKAECKYTAGTLRFFHAKTAGDNTGSADTEEIGNGCQYDEYGKTHGKCGNHGCIACSADIPGVCIVIDNVDKLCDDGRNGQRHDSIRNRCFFKDIFTSGLSGHCYDFLFCSVFCFTFCLLSLIA